MNLLVLAAGYATRLHPLTLDRAKSLLPIAGRPMIEWVLDAFAPLDPIQAMFIVTNQRFAADFETWRAGRGHDGLHGKPVAILNDRTSSDADKLGAIGDIRFAADHADLWEDDLVVIAGDNLFSQPQRRFVAQVQGRAAAIGTFDVGSLDLVKAYSAITTDPSGRISAFEEKPAQPSSTVTGVCLYYYSRAVLPRVREYLAEGNNPDQPGRLIQWLHTREAVHGVPIEGLWYDIGGKEMLEEADRVFLGWRA